VGELPRGAQRQPGVGRLDLLTVDERLLEDAVLVADAVADARHVHGRERVDEARGEAAEASVAQSGLDLLGAQGGQIDAALGESLLDDLAEVGGEQRVAELTSEEALGAQVGNLFGLDGALPGCGLEPARHEVVAHGAGEGHVLVVDGGAAQGHALVGVEFVEEFTHEPVDGVRRGGDRGQRGGVRGLVGRAESAVVQRLPLIRHDPVEGCGSGDLRVRGHV